MNSIEISVVTGTYNRLPYLKDMVESARASIPRSIPYEIILSDGGSTDGTLEWAAEQEDIRIIQGGLDGAIPAFNAGFAAARGRYVVIANDDIEFCNLAIIRALAFMDETPRCGVGCFAQDRGGKDWHIEYMPCIGTEGQKVYAAYGQVCIVPRWLGEAVGWWGSFGARTYGGDNYLSGKVWEAGYTVEEVPEARIHDRTPADALRARNTERAALDQEAYAAAFPGGIRIHTERRLSPPEDFRRPRHILYAPIFEPGYPVAKEQKRGLREALRGQGLVWEVDYMAGESVLAAARIWHPWLTLTQYHNTQLTEEQAKELRALTSGYLVNWNGDVWPGQQLDPAYAAMLRQFSLHTCVNASLLPAFLAAGVRAAYWQVAAEPVYLDPPGYLVPKCDVVFLANCYSEARRKLGEFLRSLPYRVRIYGNGWPEGWAEESTLYDFAKGRAILKGAAVAVSDSQFPDQEGFVSNRLFETLAAGGAVLLQQRVPGLEKWTGLKEEHHYLGWDEFEELREQIQWVLDNPQACRILAAQAKEAAVFDHSFGNRVYQLLGILRALPAAEPRRISVCVLHKDEDLDRLRQECQGFAHEFIAIDTRKVNPWEQGFAAVRNYAQSQATGEYILWLNPRETLSDRTIEALERFPEWLPARAAWAFTVDQGEGDTCLQVRLYPRLPGVEWRGRVHEQLDDSLAEAGVQVVPLPAARIHHPTDPRYVARRVDYLRLLHQEPPTPRTLYHLGQDHAVLGLWMEALGCFLAAYEIATDPDRESFLAWCVAHAYYRLGILGKCRKWLKESRFQDALYLKAHLDQDASAFQAYLAASAEPPPWPTSRERYRVAAREWLQGYHARELEAIRSA